jgi:plastocyanin/predicted extracellular nuclease
MKQRLLSLATTALMLLGSAVAAAAAVHNVSVNSNFFQPSTLTIQVGDQVIWTQVSGAHNVNGTQGTFPNNPVSFGSGAVAGGNWTYSFTFTIPGTYGYHCDPHAGMVGTIVVQPAAAQPCTEPFISEYLEGSSNNKALEIFNPRPTPLNMAGYSVKAYNNGGLTVSNSFTFPANVTIPAGGVYTIANSQALAGILSIADTTSTITFFNGDDAVVLFKNADTLDIIGKVGFDPGTNWTVGTGATSEFTLVRKATVNQGQRNWVVGATEWDVYPQNTITYLASHTSSACNTNPPPTGPVRTNLSVLRANDANGVATKDGDTVYVAGTVHSLDFDGNTGYSFYIEDGTAGMNIFRAADLTNYTAPAVGDSLKVYGIVDQFNGLTEIIPDSIRVIQTNRNFGSPIRITSLTEARESRYVFMDSLVLPSTSTWPATGTSANVNLTRGTQTIVLRIDNDTDIDGSPAPTGMFGVYATITQFDNASPFDAGYQLLPSKRADFVPMGALGVLTPLNVAGEVNPTTGVALRDGQVHVVRGIVTTPDFDGNTGYSFYIQDATGGINVFRTADKLNYTTPTPGHQLEIRGTIDQFNGLTEIIPDSIILLATGQTVPTPNVVTALAENTESILVRLNNMTLVNAAQWTNTGSGFNVDITNGTQTFLMRVDADVNVFGSTAPTGLFDVIGVGSQFDNTSPFTGGYQLFPRSTADIIPVITTVPTVRFVTGASQKVEGNTSNTVKLYINPTSPNASSLMMHAMAPATNALTYGTDYTTTPAASAGMFTINVPANEDTVQFSVNILDDLTQEANETANLTIMSATGLTVGSIATHVFTVIDNDIFIPTRTIPQVRGMNTAGVLDSLTKQCKLIGTVLGVNTQTTSTGNVAFTIHDGTVGFGVFSPATSNHGYTVNEGDVVRVIGKVDQYNGLGQLRADSIKIISTGASLPAPKIITAIGETTESDLVRMNNVTVVNPAQWTNAGSGFTVDVTDGTNTIQLRIDADVNLYSQPAPVGTFDVIGIGGQFDNSSPFTAGYQLLPRYIQDIVVAVPPTYDLAVTEIMANSNDADATVNADWFEITNYGTTAINLGGFSWDDNTNVAGTSVFPAVNVAPGEAIVVWSGTSANEAAFRARWIMHPSTQVIVSSQLTGAFQNLSSSADAVVLYDTSATAVEICNAIYNSTLPGKSVEFDTANAVYLGNAAVGVRGAWTSLGNDVGSPGNRNTIGLNENGLAGVRVSPNPASDRAELSLPMAGRKTIRVTNVLGQEVMATATDANQLALNVSGFQAGVYLVEVRTDLGTTTLRVVKR